MVSYQSIIQIPSTTHAPLSRSGTLVHVAFHRLSTSCATACHPWSIGDYYQNRSVIEGEAWYPRYKEKNTSFSRLPDDKPHVLPYPYCCGLVELNIPHPRILETTSITH